MKHEGVFKVRDFTCLMNSLHVLQGQLEFGIGIGFRIFYFDRNFVPQFWTYRRCRFNTIPFSTWYVTVTIRLIPQIIWYISNFKYTFHQFWGYSSFNFIWVISLCRFRRCKGVELSLLHSSSSKGESKLLYRKALSWSLLMLEFSFRLWNIHTTGQYEKWKVTKEFIMSLLCSKFIDLLTWHFYHTLAKFDSQNKIWAFYENVLRGFQWARILVYWTFCYI